MILYLSTNRSIFGLLHKSGNADKPDPVPSIENNNSRKEQRQESTAGGVRPPILAIPGMSLLVLRHVTEHCHAGGYLFRVSLGTVTVSSSMLSSNASIAFNTDPLM